MVGRLWRDKLFHLHLSRYKVGEIYAIAQSYETVYHEQGLETLDMLVSSWKNSKGWRNKLFVRADAMTHHIRIINVKIERLQDIDDESCMKEGIGKYFLGFDSPHTDCMGFTYSILMQNKPLSLSYANY